MRIKAFDPSTIRIGRKMLWVGGSGRGKSFHCRFILSHIAPHVDMCLLFCPTETTRSEFADIIPMSHMYSTLDLEVVAKVLALQRDNVEKGKKRTILLCMDDCSFCKKLAPEFEAAAKELSSSGGPPLAAVDSESGAKTMQSFLVLRLD